MVLNLIQCIKTTPGRLLTIDSDVVPVVLGSQLVELCVTGSPCMRPARRLEGQHTVKPWLQAIHILGKVLQIVHSYMYQYIKRGMEDIGKAVDLYYGT